MEGTQPSGKKSRGWLNAVIVTLLIFLLLNSIVGTWFKEKMTDKGKYGYCVEWGGFIDRSGLVFQCYNFMDKEIICDWEISDDQSVLTVYNYPRTKVIATHKCTVYTKMIEKEYANISEYFEKPGVPIDLLTNITENGNDTSTE